MRRIVMSMVVTTTFKKAMRGVQVMISLKTQNAHPEVTIFLRPIYGNYSRT